MTLLHLGVTAFGVPVFFKHFGKVHEDKEMILSSLIETLQALGDQLKYGHIDSLSFGKSTLYVTLTKKGYRVIAVADTSEQQIKNLVRKIAEDIDSDPTIPEPTGFVDNVIMDRIKEILERYVKDDIDIPPEKIHLALRNIIELLAKKDNFKERFEMLEKSLELSIKKKHETWSEIFENAKGTISEAIRMAWDGDIRYASGILLKVTDDPIYVAAAVKLGIFANLICGYAAPPISLLKQLATFIPEDNPFSKHIKRAILWMQCTVNFDEYLQSLKSALEAFRFEGDLKSQAKSFVLLDFNLDAFPEYTQKLRDYYSRFSNLYRDFLDSLVRRRELMERIRQAGTLAEIINITQDLESTFKDIIEKNKKFLQKQLDKVLSTKRIITQEIAQHIISVSIITELYLTTLTQAILYKEADAKTKLEFFEKAYGVYKETMMDFIQKGSPMFMYSYAQHIKNYALLLELGARLCKSGRLSEIAREFNRLARVCVDILVRENYCVIPYIHNLLTTSAAYLSTMFYLDQTPLIVADALFIASKILNEKCLENLHRTNRDIYIQMAMDIFSQALLLGIQEGSDYEELLYYLEKLIDMVKWQFFYGYITPNLNTRIALFAEHLLRIIPDEYLSRFYMIVEPMLSLFDILLMDPENQHADFIMYSDTYVSFLYSLSQKLEREDLAEKAKRIAETAKEIFRTYGYKDKIKKLESIFEKKDFENTILDLF